MGFATRLALNDYLYVYFMLKIKLVADYMWYFS